MKYEKVNKIIITNIEKKHDNYKSFLILDIFTLLIKIKSIFYYSNEMIQIIFNLDIQSF